MAGDLTILIVPGRLDAALLVEAAREAFAARVGGDLAALVVDEDGADPALAEKVGPFSAVSFWLQGQEELPIEPFVLALSKRLGKRRLMVAWATEFFGSSGWRVFEGGKVGRAETFKDDGIGVTAVKEGGIEAAFGKPASGFDVNALAFGSRGVKLLPLEEAGAPLAKEDAERVLYDADPLLFSGAGEFKTVRRPRPKRRAKRLNQAITELPTDWKTWTRQNLHVRSTLPVVLKFLEEGGVDDAEAKAFCDTVLAERAKELRAGARGPLMAGLAVALFGAAWLLAPLAEKRGRIDDPLPKAAVIAAGALIAGYGLRQRLLARACE